MIQIRTSRTILVQASDTSAKGYHHRTSIVQLAQLLLDFRSNSKVQLLRLGQRNNVNPRGSEISSEGAETLKQQANMFRHLYGIWKLMCIKIIKSLRQQITYAHLRLRRFIAFHQHVPGRCAALRQSTIVLGLRVRERKPALHAVRRWTGTRRAEIMPRPLPIPAR